MKTLIAYGTRYGATERSARVLGGELSKTYGHEVRVMDAGKVTGHDLDWAGQVVIGSSIVHGHWKSSSKSLLKLADRKTKPIAVFVSAAVSLSEKISEEELSKGGDGKIDRVQYAIEHFIDPICGKYRVKPIAKTAFGGKLSVFGNVVVDNQNDAIVKEWAGKISAG